MYICYPSILEMLHSFENSLHSCTEYEVPDLGCGLQRVSCARLPSVLKAVTTPPARSRSMDVEDMSLISQTALSQNAKMPAPWISDIDPKSDFSLANIPSASSPPRQMKRLTLQWPLDLTSWI